MKASGRDVDDPRRGRAGLLAVKAAKLEPSTILHKALGLDCCLFLVVCWFPGRTMRVARSVMAAIATLSLNRPLTGPIAIARVPSARVPRL